MASEPSPTVVAAVKAESGGKRRSGMKQRGAPPSMFNVPQELAHRGAREVNRTFTFGNHLFRLEDTSGSFLTETLVMLCHSRPLGSFQGGRILDQLQEAFKPLG